MMPRENVLTPEEIRALLQGSADAESPGGLELLRELVQLVMTAAVQQPALGLPPLQRLRVADVVPEPFDEWWARARKAPGWAGLQLQGELQGLLTVILHQPPSELETEFLSPLLRGLLREVAARMNRWLRRDAPLAVSAWSGPRGAAEPPGADEEDVDEAGEAEQEMWSLACHVESQEGPWSLEIGISRELAEAALGVLNQPLTASAAGGASAAPRADSPDVARSVSAARAGEGYDPGTQEEQLAVRPARFPPLMVEPQELEEDEGESERPELMDLPLRVTVELGRTRLPIERIMELKPGVTIELDRLAGEMVDVLVNGKLIAKGEVVVVDDAFGVKITDILSPIERMRGLS